MSTLRISDAPLLPDVDGTEKIPTGGRGDYAISVDQIKGHIFQDVDKELVGLGNVDNTSDLDKPVSTAQQAALNFKADKTYVDTNLDLKADKTNVYTRSETTLALSTKADLVNGVVPENQIPSSFNDVLEFTTANLPIVGESGKIYVTTDNNKTWRWGGNKYVEISGWNPDSVSKSLTLPTYYTKEAGVDPITGVADGAYFNVRSSSDELYVDEYQNAGGSAVATGKRYLSALGVQLQEKPANTIKDVNGKNQQQINDAVAGRLLSSFGAIPDDINKASENDIAFGLAIEAGGSVIFDGFYHIAFSAAHVIDSDLTLTAQNKGDGFNVVSRTQPVRIGDNVSFRVDSIKLRATGVTGGLFSTVSDLTYVEAVDVIDSDIDVGAMRLFSSDFSTTADPETTQYGIKHVKILNNVIANASILFVGTNAQHELIEIKGNRLSNISNGVISFGRTNGHAYERKLKSYMKRMEFWDNTTINDDNFFATATGTYLSTIVYEGDYLEAYRNHTEGLKSRNVVAIYDIYANSTVLDYQGNTWKNNLCMNVNKTNGDLLKSKGTPVSTYKNNKFILEKSFIDRHGANIDGMTWVSLFQKIYGDDSSNMIIHDNIFDVYELAGMPASQLSKSVDMRRNTFKFQRCSGVFLIVNNSNADTTTYADADINIIDNDFIIEDAGINMLRAGATINVFSILGVNHSTTAGKGDYRSININRNRIKIKNLHSAHYINPEGVAKFVDTSGNEVDVTNLTSSTAYRSLGDLSGVKSAGRSKGNILNGALSETGLNAFLPANKPYEFNNEVNGAYRNWYTHVLAPTTNSLWVYVKIDAFASTGKFSATYKAKLTPTGLEYEDSAGVAQTLAYPATTAYSYVNPKVYKLSEIDELLSGVRLGLRNSDNVGGALRIDFYNTNLTAGINVKFNVAIQTIVTT